MSNRLGDVGRQMILQLSLVDQGMRAAVAENIHDCRRSKTVIDRNRRPGAQLSRSVGLHVLRAILRQNRDAMAALHTKLLQGIGQPERSFSKFTVRDRPPLEDDRGRGWPKP